MPLKDLMGATEFEQREFIKIAREISERSCEALRIYEPLPFQQAFHECTSKECVIIKANRAGGSVAGFVEDARAALNRDPFKKYPPRDGTIVCLGFGEKHIGRVIHKFLFRAGVFRIIRDLETKCWRVFKPWPKEQGGDEGRENEAKPAPPLIPPRCIADDGMVWENRGNRVFSICRLTTGWEIYALNSAGDPAQAQGFDVNLYHIDEDTAQPGWYEEAVGRTAMPKGLIRWTALPHSKNEDILNMVQRAQDEADNEHPLTVSIRATMFDNPYYPKESREASLKIWAAQGEDVVRKRAYGEMVIDTLLVYPDFSKYVHTIYCDDPDNEHPVQRAYRETGGTPPNSWCRSMIVDPGHTVCAVVFIATPPPELGDIRVVYDELYLLRCDANKFGVEVHKKASGQQFERFIIDAHGGRLRDIGSGITPQRQYESQLKERGITCNASANFFMNGSDDIQGREECLRQWLRIGEGGVPKVLIDTQKCPNLARELERFKKKTVKVGGNQVVLEEANRRSPCHAIEGLEYGAANGLEYIKPKNSRVVNTWVRSILRGREERERQRKMKSPESAKNTISLAPRGAML